MSFEFIELKNNREWEMSVNKDGVYSIYNTKGIGALQVSSFEIPRNYELNLFDELYDFSSEYVKEVCQYKSVFPLKDGYLLDSIPDGNRKWLFAILNHKRDVLFLTYNSLAEDFEIEHQTIISIINSVKWID